MNVLILGLNYAPEPVGIGPYTTGMAEALAAAGHGVSVVCAKPYYPYWQVEQAFRGVRAQRGIEGGAKVIRVPIYVPRAPNGARRLLHHASFALRAFPALLAEARRQRPHVVVAIAPSLLSAAIARAVARLLGAKLWLHVQDFELDAAFATGLLPGEGALSRAARAFETWSLEADRVSTISPQMCARLSTRGVASDKIVEFRNWATLDDIAAGGPARGYRQEWGIDRPHVAVYSGAIGHKQGIELIVEAARRLQHPVIWPSWSAATDRSGRVWPQRQRVSTISSSALCNRVSGWVNCWRSPACTCFRRSPARRICCSPPSSPTCWRPAVRSSPPRTGTPGSRTKWRAAA